MPLPTLEPLSLNEIRLPRKCVDCEKETKEYITVFRSPLGYKLEDTQLCLKCFTTNYRMVKPGNIDD